MKAILVTSILACAVAATAAPSTTPTGHRTVALPATAGEGKPVEPRVLADTPYLKTVVIVLRKGATLTEHASPHAATIQALAGRGTVRMGKQRVQVSPTQMVLLDPGVKHEVIADPGVDLVLLVHHLKGAGTTKPAAAKPAR